MALTKRGQTFTFDDLDFYAWGGVIVMRDRGKEQDVCATASEFEERANALQAALDKEIYGDRRFEIQNAIDNMKACVKQARDQGDPTDPEVLQFLAKHSRRRQFSGASIATTGKRIQEAVGAARGATSTNRTKLWVPTSYR